MRKKKHVLVGLDHVRKCQLDGEARLPDQHWLTTNEMVKRNEAACK